MAFCIECGATLEPTAVRCDACGFEFPQISEDEFVRVRTRVGWAYSPVADLVLIIAQALAGLVAVIALICVMVFAGILLYHINSLDHPPTYLLNSIGILFSSLVWLIVLIRVGNL